MIFYVTLFASVSAKKKRKQMRSWIYKLFFAEERLLNHNK